jgi:hypothetical protein
MMDLGILVLKYLAVAGGAAVGGFGCGGLLRLLARMTVRHPVPRPMKLTVQLLGAVACALLVWKLAFGPGGSGWGGGEGFGLGSGSGNGQATTSKAEPLFTPDTKRTPEPIPQPSPAAGEILRIEMLGGERVRQERFYLVEGDREPKTLAELRQTLKARQGDKAKPPLKGIEIVIYENSVAQNHPAVRDLERWARQNDLAVTLLRK